MTYALVEDARAPRTPAADAYSTHQQFWADSGGDVQLPIDPYELARRMGVNVYRAILGPRQSGYLALDQNGAAIYVNDAFSNTRNRFTVAHELGHYVDLRNRGLLSRGGTYTYDRADLAATGTDPDEIYANRFAASLLMPADSVRAAHGRGLSLRELAGRFNVSEAAMENRLANLGLRRD